VLDIWPPLVGAPLVIAEIGGVAPVPRIAEVVPCVPADRVWQVQVRTTLAGIRFEL
jgi:hypothetical protein